MKTCIAPNCISPVFSHNFCLRHGYLRTDRKKPKRTLLKKSDKKPVHYADFGFPDQITMFEALWEAARDKRGRVICEYTGTDLTGLEDGTVEMWVCCFAHILNKKNYTYFKLNPANIDIVDPEFHRIIDSGTYADRAKHPSWKWDVWDALVIEMKEQYQKFKKDNLLA